MQTYEEIDSNIAFAKLLIDKINDNIKTRLKPNLSFSFDYCRDRYGIRLEGNYKFKLYDYQAFDTIEEYEYLHKKSIEDELTDEEYDTFVEISDRVDYYYSSGATIYINDKFVITNENGYLTINGIEVYDIATYIDIMHYNMFKGADNHYHIYEFEDVTEKVKRLRNNLINDIINKKLYKYITYRAVPITTYTYKTIMFDRYLLKINNYYATMQLSI